MKIGIYLIGTNAYFPLAIRFIRRFDHFYRGCHTLKFFLFSDKDPEEYLPENIDYKYFKTSHNDWVSGTNSKFKNILDNLASIDVDHLYYFDADTNIHKEFNDWFVGNLVAGEHYGNSTYMKTCNVHGKPFDRVKTSSCYLSGSDDQYTYCYGAFFGGNMYNLIPMLDKLDYLMNINKINSHEPIFNDESYLNYYFNTHNVSIIPTEKFEFQVSCKGGLEHTRNPNLKTSYLNDKIKNHKEEIFDIIDGEFVLSNGLRLKNKTDIENCYYINPDHYNFRKNDIKSVVDKLNVKISHRINENILEDNKIKKAANSHIKALEKALILDQFPLLILEDDAKMSSDIIKLPDTYCNDTVGIYLGGSLYPAGGGVYLEDYNEYYYRVYNMLSNHAIYIPNRKSGQILKLIYERAFNKGEHIDIEVAKLSNEFIFLTPKNGPYFFQDDNLTRDVTLFKWENNLHLLKM